jgi:hypothetical protein
MPIKVMVRMNVWFSRFQHMRRSRSSSKTAPENPCRLGQQDKAPNEALNWVGISGDAPAQLGISPSSIADLRRFQLVEAGAPRAVTRTFASPHKRARSGHVSA